MKILILSINNNKGGAESILKQIYDYYLSIGCDIEIWFLFKTNSDYWESDKYNIHYISEKDSIKSYFKLIHIIFRNFNNYDRIHTSHSKLTFITSAIRIFKSKKTIIIGRESTNSINRYNGLKLLTYKILYKLLYKNVSVVICQSGEMKKSFSKYIPEEKLIHIKNPFRISNTNLKVENVNNNKEYLITGGRLIYEKGFDLLIQAFNNIKDKIDLDLHIYGEGPEKIKLDMLITKLKLNDRVFLKNYSNNLIFHFKKARACIVSSRIEGFPNVLLEMMSVNKNIISTICSSDIKDISGIYHVKPNNVRDLELNILRCLNSNNQNSREKFDKELEDRNIKNFMKILNEKIKVS